MLYADWWWLQPLAVLLGIGVATAAILSNRHTVRLKETLDLIEASEAEQFYQDRYAAYVDFRTDAEKRLAVLSGDNRELRAKCLDFMNHYELVALSARKGIIDADFYRNWMGSTLVRDWNAARDLVRSIRLPPDGRPGRPRAFIEFERLAVAWGGIPLATPWWKRPDRR